MPTPEVLREIRRATRHHGVAVGADLDLSRRQRNICCTNGTLELRHPGVFVDPARPRTALQDLAAAVAAAGPLSAAWGRSSGYLWGLWPELPATPEIVVPYGRPRRIHGVSVRRSRALNASLITERQHIRVTKPLVTLLDLGMVVGALDVAEVIILGRQKRLFSVPDVRATVDRFARPGRNGLTTARQALDLVMIGERPAESVLELYFHIGPGRFGLPAYSYQHEVKLGRKTYYIDVAYPEVMLAIEVDGYEKRAARASLDYDNERANALTLAGWTLLRFGWTKVRAEPEQVARDIVIRLGQLGYPFRREPAPRASVNPTPPVRWQIDHRRTRAFFCDPSVTLLVADGSM
jgi:very-short-patch-repair endonuclease